MTGTTLFSHLLLGVAGATVVFVAARRLCARRPVRETDAEKDAETGNVPQEDSPAAVAAVYGRVLARRLWALVLCLAALLAWLLGCGWQFCLLPACAGCVMLFFAYRLRTTYTMTLMKQRQARQVAGGHVSEGRTEICGSQAP